LYQKWKGGHGRLFYCVKTVYAHHMRTIRLYLPTPLAINTTVELGADAAHHAQNVLRMKTGDVLVVFNGEGGEYDATIASSSKKSTVVQINQFHVADRESPLHTHLAIGISKGERFEHVLQKATELGVSEITPLFSERTEVRLNAERQEKIRQRWQKIMINACEQCYRNRLPKLNLPVEFRSLIADETSTQKFILHPQDDHAEHVMLSQLPQPASACLLVGPEGGFSDNEVMLAMQCHFAPLALGSRILRTETAPLAALSVLQFMWGDLSASS
jgi:16S rRNA (uracil1498-N3)-methyltransferase